MEPRLRYAKIASDLYRKLHELYQAIDETGFDRTILHLVYLRASQINGCAACLDMHSKDARALGETEQRIYALNAWRDAPFFTERERAALALTDALTLVAERGLPDDVYDEAARQFDEKELTTLIWAVAEINTWNRLNVAARSVAGGYRSKYESKGAR